MNKWIVCTFFGLGVFLVTYLLASVIVTVIFISGGILTAQNFMGTLPQMVGVTALASLVPAGFGFWRLLTKGVKWK